jgi:hypothetical protein
VSISGDYSNPVYVNGYQCWNCTQVDQATKGVDPANPKAGPYGVNAQDERPSPALSEWGQAETLGGIMSTTPARQGGAQASNVGTKVDVSL